MILAVALATLTLYQQSVKGLLEQRFAATEFLLLDARTGEIVASTWRAPAEAAPVGSLVKPLLVAAQGRAELPAFSCTGRRCWLPRGHGQIDVIRALADSCNEYFEALARQTPPDRLANFVARYQLGGPTGESMIGRGSDWSLAPLRLLHAYRALSSHPVIHAGMLRSAAHGTASALHGGALAKTGTSACAHSPKGPGDGLVVVLFPETKPEWALLVRVHGTTGAVTADRAQQIVRTIREGK